MNGKAKGYWLAAVAALTCPCHIPILILALSGTAVGALLADNLAAALAIMTIAFLLSVRAALRVFTAPISGRPRIHSDSRESEET